MTPQPAPGAFDTSAATSTGHSKGRILVVDDDRLVLATVSHGLAQAGYDVIDADNGDEAILLAREHRPELALLDIRMEGMSGLDVALTLRDAYRIPFIFLSAFSDAATLAQVHALGALAYLVKPLDVGQIVPSVADALARVRAAAAAAAVSAGTTPAAAGGTGGAGGEARTGRAATVDSTSAAAVAAVPAAAGTAVPAWPTRAAVPMPPAGVGAGLPSSIDPVPMAVGVLMHRHSLTRSDALLRLQRLAQGSGLGAAAQAERLLAAVEELARSAL